MKYEWSVEDIQGGRSVQCNTNATNRWGIITSRQDANGRTYAHVSLQDGMEYSSGTAEELAASFNASGVQPTSILPDRGPLYRDSKGCHQAPSHYRAKA